MWSVVEKTALAEAEVEYHEHQSSTTIWVKLPGCRRATRDDLSERQGIVIWTTTPWTMPAATGRSAVKPGAFDYALYEVTERRRRRRPGPKVGDRYLVLARPKLVA